MQWTLTLPFVFLAACNSIPRADEGGSGTQAARANRATFYLGARKFDEDDWSPVEEQGVFGAEFSHRVGVIGWEVGFLAAANEEREGGVKTEGSSSELYGGLRLEFGDDVIRPYIGAGVTAIATKLDVEGLDDDDDGTLAVYVHVGFTVDVTERVYLGLDARGVFGSDVEVLGVDRDVDYGQLALALGFSF
ncbi:MAG: outer membrane beta-barrel protein [Planctomycetota bacterium]|nr:outer membrane beta-barrel protein [Planctomycetota bacterium]